MQLVKQGGKTVLRITNSQWKRIGQQAGWLTKEAIWPFKKEDKRLDDNQAIEALRKIIVFKEPAMVNLFERFVYGKERLSFVLDTIWQLLFDSYDNFEQKEQKIKYRDNNQQIMARREVVKEFAKLAIEKVRLQLEHASSIDDRKLVARLNSLEEAINKQYSSWR